MRFSVFALCLYVIALLHTPAAQADSRFPYCEKGESTADVMACVKKRYEDAQDSLDRVFEQGMAGLDFEDTQLYRAAQKSWVTYRDRECAWQARQADSESLKRIKELSCLKIVTELRTAALQAAFGEQKDKNTLSIAPAIPEQAGTPLWMNVLAGENPDIYWRYGDRIEADLDCDGTPDNIMAGLKTGFSKTDSSQQTITALIGIAESPLIGRPRAYIVELPPAPEDPISENTPQTEKELPLSCGTALSLQVSERPAPADIPGEKDEKTVDTEDAPQAFCTAALLVKRAHCPSALIYWNGNGFDIENIPDR